jgi:hypothetical protein
LYSFRAPLSICAPDHELYKGTGFIEICYACMQDTYEVYYVIDIQSVTALVMCTEACSRTEREIMSLGQRDQT